MAGCISRKTRCQIVARLHVRDAEPLKTIPLGLLKHEDARLISRDGYCRTSLEDHGLHTICCQITQPFLEIQALQGNDLIAPPQIRFPGLDAKRMLMCLSAELGASV